MNTDNMIEITGTDLITFVQKVYELSVPQGMGILHFTPQPLSTEDAVNLVDMWEKDNRFAVCMDYVSGRSCKMNVFRDEDNKLWIRDDWYDHTNSQLKELLIKIA